MSSIQFPLKLYISFCLHSPKLQCSKHYASWTQDIISHPGSVKFKASFQENKHSIIKNFNSTCIFKMVTLQHEWNFHHHISLFKRIKSFLLSLPLMLTTNLKRVCTIWRRPQSLYQQATLKPPLSLGYKSKNTFSNNSLNAS